MNIKHLIVSIGFMVSSFSTLAQVNILVEAEDAGKLAFIPKGAERDISKDVYKGRAFEFGWNVGLDDKTA